MKLIAVEKAGKRLQSAEEALKRIRTCSDFATFEAAWSDLLIALNSIHSILENGASTFPKSAGWYSKKKGERRADPLLQYLKQARNADEHGIEPVARLKPGGMTIGGAGQSFDLYSLRTVPDGLGGMQIEVVTGPGQTPHIGFFGPSAKLVPVTNRGISYAPPKEYLGARLADQTPLTVAELGLEYHQTLLEEAATLVG